MLDWLMAPTCPCDPAAKAWIEERLEWLAEEFDDSAFSGRRLVLPTPAFFPDSYDGTNATVRTLLDRVCGYMDVDPDIVSLEIVAAAKGIGLVNEHGHEIAEAAGTYEAGGLGPHIRIDKSGLHDPMSLVGTIAHELAHQRLLGEGRITNKIFDNEILTDLTVVHFGLGIFLANAPRNWRSGTPAGRRPTSSSRNTGRRRCSAGPWRTWHGSAAKRNLLGLDTSLVPHARTCNRACATCSRPRTRSTGRSGTGAQTHES